MQKIDDFLNNNKLWANKIKKENPAYFELLAKEQKPELLWIGCSDSRVPAELVVSAQPGEMFIHRNIANQVIATDFNCLSVLQYAVNVLQVKHIVVCGHYNCGGVKAALNKQNAQLLITNKWLMHIKNVYRLYQNEIDMLPTEEQRVNRLVELNIIEQVHALSHTSIIQEAWDKHKRPMIHGWVYGISDGLINPLIKLKAGDAIHPIYEYEPAES
ncbi:carbonate dehydratase [Methylomarinum sp. Ch1-1]|uniref:Carbonic anhydrase n=1 Tax=Methylomarinum roseum TaxID=3067653 RepID=A0AAU7NYV4_9GAMM|nr:carbonate dehydratase [Methylomarinum sp. Ch1-1]MDP4521753.1 carbonate dehydratase [Methylomarinum sp. Ch1-1]